MWFWVCMLYDDERKLFRPPPDRQTHTRTFIFHSLRGGLLLGSALLRRGVAWGVRAPSPRRTH